MKIYVLTPIYATATSRQGATPVVHYFAREWVKFGHSVTVFNFCPKYPKPMYWISRRYQHQLNTRLGMLVPLFSPEDEDYEAEGVIVHKKCLKKVMPHSRYSKKQIKLALNYIDRECERNGVPDWFLGHWDNPQLEILYALKHKFGKPICLVLHGNEFNFEKKYGVTGLTLVSQLDVIGFRSYVGRANFVKKYGEPKRSFIASSGVSANFLDAGAEQQRLISQPVHNFVYVGSLISRKYPTIILTALTTVYPDGNFKLTYIGDGAEMEHIEEEYQRLGKIGELCFTGRIPRDEIIQYLQNSDVFVMISQNETFGLVYLEAMAFGLITVGSRDEGIDGVIRDNENGFLCEAGSVKELTEILRKIKDMPVQQLHEISHNAKKTANEYSDKGVAVNYLNSLKK